MSTYSNFRRMERDTRRLEKRNRELTRQRINLLKQQPEGWSDRQKQEARVKAIDQELTRLGIK